MSSSEVRVRLLSWNVRHCRGLDHRVVPSRVLELLGAAEADVIALQELDVGRARSARVDQPSWLASRLGMELVFCETLPEGGYGHALLTRLSVRERRTVSLPSGRGAEPRKLIDVELGHGSARLRVLSTHLSLGREDRAAQACSIASVLRAVRGPAVLLGDLNAGPGQRGYEELVAAPLCDPLRVHPLRRRCTWPSPWPFRAIDHVLLTPSLRAREVRVHASGAARFASDHRPVVADAELPAEPG